MESEIQVAASTVGGQSIDDVTLATANGRVAPEVFSHLFNCSCPEKYGWLPGWVFKPENVSRRITTASGGGWDTTCTNLIGVAITIEKRIESGRETIFTKSVSASTVRDLTANDLTASVLAQARAMGTGIVSVWLGTFVEDFVPTAHSMTKSEWETCIEFMRPAIAFEKSILDRAAIIDARITDEDAHRRLPLGGQIAAGVVEALKAMGVTPKPAS